jgi:hypothetical protein
MKRFQMYRKGDISSTHDANQRNSPDQVQFEGVVFTDGRCAIRWLTSKGSTSVWDSFEDMMAIHGHPEYGSEIVWLDEEPVKDVLHYAVCLKCDTEFAHTSPIVNTFCTVCKELGYISLGILNSQPASKVTI